MIAAVVSVLFSILSIGQEYAGYLYCHMSRDGEWTSYALSEDGVHFHDLFEGAPIMNTEEHAPIEGGQRDAFIYRRHDNSGYLMVTTDMQFAKSHRWNNHGIDLHTSDDLIKWETTGFDFNDGPDIFSDSESPDVVAWSKVDRVWAPQIIWNPEAKAYMIYYSMRTSEEGDYDKVYYSYSDESFSKITKPRLLFDWGYSTIDADINFVEADGKYHMLIKKHNSNENQIYRTESSSLTGPWPEPQTEDYISFEDHRACEGASAFQLIGDSTWRVAYTEYTSHPRKYRICRADEHLSHFRDPEDIQGVSAPEHGSFMLITREEYERLEAWGKTGIPERHVSENDFHTSLHPRVFVTENDRPSILEKVSRVSWAKDIVAELHRQIDPVIAIHKDNPGYVISRMPMNWETGKRYTRFYTEGNILNRREGNAKYPTIRVKYTRAASNSVPVAPLDKLIPYSDGTMTIEKGTVPGIVKIDDNPFTSFYDLGSDKEYDTIPFEQTGIGADALTRTFLHTAWKSSILYYLTGNKDYAKLSADIIWTIVRGAAQHEWVNPGEKGASGYLSFETLDDTRHYSTLPLAYDMIYDYLHEEYFDLDQFKNGLDGELWAPPHPEGKQWALNQFEIVFKNMIENKLQRGGGLIGNWNTNEQQSAMLYALALDGDESYDDGKGRAYYVDRLVYGPTTRTHGAYLDVLRANISPNTGLWPEAPGGYGQGGISQLIRFGYIYYRNGLDYMSLDPLLRKASGAMPQMIFPNGYVTNYGDATYATINTDQLELMMSYYSDKGDVDNLREVASLMQFIPERNYGGEFFFPLFFYLPELPDVTETLSLEKASCSEDYSIVIERNMSSDPQNSLAFSLMGFGARTGHRQPNGMNIELYGRGHILAPDQGIGQDYWSRDTQLYKANVAGHNTVTPNGMAADNRIPQNLEWVNAEPAFGDGESPESSVSASHQYVEAHNHFYTAELKAEQRRVMGIVRTSPQSGYYVDIFRSKVVEGHNDYHDYIYHNVGIGADVTDMAGKRPAWIDAQLDTLSGKGYGYFKTIGVSSMNKGIVADFHLGAADADMKVFIPKEKNRIFYYLESPSCHRYYINALKNQPVPAFLVRNEGESWEKPFITVFEPHGKDCPSRIRSVSVEKTRSEQGVSKLTVRMNENKRKDIIIHSVAPEKTAHYAGVEFMGVYGVVSFDGKQVLSAYLGAVRRFETAGIEVVAAEPCNVYLEQTSDGLTVCSDGPVLVNGKQY